MKSFTKHTGRAVAVYRPNIDTDQIIPKQFLKRIERTGYGEFLFHDWRYRSDGSPDPDFVLNDPRSRGASVLIAGANFGCGSSREHAPWALSQFGFRAVIAPSFADIFYNNSLNNGFLPVALDDGTVAAFAERAQTLAEYPLTIDLESQTVSDDHGPAVRFEIEPFRKHCLLNGLDDIALSLEHAGKIAEFEASRPVWADYDNLR
jgi:3-isopropylmalate/(R)-2-methylmalate dehydratase small subunit